MKKLRLGIVGTGGICNNKHLPSLAKVADQVEVVALCDLIEEKAKATAKRHGLTEAKIYTDYKEMLADKSIDIIHVCTPNVAHCQITVDAFEAGKHVLCEKPMAATSSDAKKMIDAWKKSGKKFTVGYQNRYRPDVQVLKKSCEAGELGEVYYAEANGIDLVVCFPFSAGIEKQKKLSELIAPYPGRFMQLAFINPNDPDAKEQLLYCLDELGCKGMKLHPWFGNFSLANIELLRPLMEVLEERRLYTVVHCTSEDYRVHPVMFERLGLEFPHVIIQMAHMGEVMAGEYAIV